MHHREYYIVLASFCWSFRFISCNNREVAQVACVPCNCKRRSVSARHWQLAKHYMLRSVRSVVPMFRSIGRCLPNGWPGMDVATDIEGSTASARSAAFIDVVTLTSLALLSKHPEKSRIEGCYGQGSGHSLD